MLAASGWLLFHPREPKYDGKPLTYWLKAYNDISTWRTWQSDYAIQQIGTNAIPFLLRELQANDSKLKKWFRERAWDHYYRLHLQPGDFPSDEERQERASEAFHALGPIGRPAVPALILIYRQNGSDDFQNVILNALGNIGPAADEAVPFLLQELNTTNEERRAIVERVIQSIHGRPDLVLPLAMAMATNDSLDVYGSGLLIISAYGSNARPAIQVLLRIAGNGTNESRGRQAWAYRILGKLQVEPGVVVPGLIKGLYTTNGFSKNVAELLAGYGTNASSAVPALLRSFDDSNNSARTAAASALLRVAPEDTNAATAALSWLHSQIGSTNIESRVDAAIALFRANPGDIHAFEIIVACMKTQSLPRISDTQVHSIGSVGKLGPLGKPFVPTLIGLLRAPRGAEYDVRVFAAEALRKIDPEAHDKALEEFVKQIK